MADEKAIKVKGCPYCGKFGGVTCHKDFASIPTYHCNKCGKSWSGILPLYEPSQTIREAENRMDDKTIKAKENSWFRCPHCGKALFPIQENTRIQHMPFRCKACKHDIEVNI